MNLIKTLTKCATARPFGQFKARISCSPFKRTADYTRSVISVGEGKSNGKPVSFHHPTLLNRRLDHYPKLRRYVAAPQGRPLGAVSSKIRIQEWNSLKI